MVFISIGHWFFPKNCDGGDDADVAISAADVLMLFEVLLMSRGTGLFLAKSEFFTFCLFLSLPTFHANIV